MRSEKEMTDFIIETARRDDRIRAVILNGSRANPNAKPDIFQDFDVVYVVTEVESFRTDPGWIDIFGERMILQCPEDMSDPPPEDNGHYAYLIQFADGNRIDLTLCPLDLLDQFTGDSLSVAWLDKDGILPEFPAPGERDYLPQPPTAKLYADCCNEFWWVATYVAKGLWREEITYAKSMLDQVVRVELMKMLAWQIGVQTDFAVNPGKAGKYFDQYLPPEDWRMLLATYAGAGYVETWDSLDAMTRLFRKSALMVAAHFGFDYPRQDDDRVSAHLAHVRKLPKDATKMYSQSI